MPALSLTTTLRVCSSQCAAHCSDTGCSTAGVGKCDLCVNGYGPTANYTCAPVRLLDERALRACVLRRVSPQAFLVCAPWTAVRSPLHLVQLSRGRQVQSM